MKAYVAKAKKDLCTLPLAEANGNTTREQLELMLISLLPPKQVGNGFADLVKGFYRLQHAWVPQN
jgi:hypothetical protein